MATQYPGTSRSMNKIIQGGAPDSIYYTEERKVKTGVTVYPGNLVSGNGETEGEVDLAASGDGAASFIEIVLERIGVKPQDIDTGITQGQYIKTLRPSGGRFIVAATRADESNDTELGEPMVLEATGHMQKRAYTNSADATDTLIEWVGRCAEVTVDVASTDLVQLMFF